MKLYTTIVLVVLLSGGVGIAKAIKKITKIIVKKVTSGKETSRERGMH